MPYLTGTAAVVEQRSGGVLAGIQTKKQPMTEPLTTERKLWDLMQNPLGTAGTPEHEASCARCGYCWEPEKMNEQPTLDPKCPHCRGRGAIEVHTISNDTCDGQWVHSVRHRKCRRCDGHGHLPPPNSEPSEQGVGWPEGAEPLQCL
jgi:hypothetical protein